MSANRTRRAFSSLSRKLRKPKSTRQLADRAGQTMLEPLEERKLLFSLTIDSSGPTSATVGYAIPQLLNLEEVEETPEEPTIVTLDFNAIDGPARITNSQVIGDSGVAIILGGPAGSGLVSPTPNSSVELVPQGADIETERLRVRLDENGEAVTFGESGDLEDGELPQLGRLRPIDIAQFELQGFDAANIRLELLLGGEVVQTISGVSGWSTILSAGTLANGTFRVTQATTGGAFDAFRLVADPGQLSDFFIDDISLTQSFLGLAAATAERVRGFQVFFSGPIGATVQFFDLYGRPMVNTFDVGELEGLDGVVLIDRNGDGVPDFNDGIGRIVLSGVDERTVLRITGGTIEGATENDEDPRTVFSGQFLYDPTGEFVGIYDGFEESGFGFEVDPGGDGDPSVVGLPPGQGSVIIGSPFVRGEQPGNDNYSPNVNDYRVGLVAQYEPTESGSYSRSQQGIFVQDGSTMGDIAIHGMLFGSSAFSSSLGTLSVGNLYGSIGVAADLGQLIVAADAGVWTTDTDAPTIRDAGATDPNSQSTGASLVVGRTAREIAIGGRSRLNVTVEGDISNTALTGLDQLNYFEREFISTVSPDNDTGETAVFDRAFRNTPIRIPFGFGDEQFFNPIYAFGANPFRNDAILSAEYVGGLTSGVSIFGSLGAFDNFSNREDSADVYAFASDGQTPVAFQASGAVLITIRDVDGRVLASPNVADRGFFGGTGFSSGVLEFVSNAPGVYYLSVTSVAGADGNSGAIGYAIDVLGIKPTTLGSYRVAGGSYANTINVQNGDMGSARIGTGYFSYTGGETDSLGVINPDNDEGDAENMMRLFSGAYSVAGTLFGLISGSDLETGDPTTGSRGGQTSIITGRDFGALEVGVAPVAGIAPNEGDIGDLLLQAGRNIGVIDVRGSVGFSLENTAVLPGSTGFTTIIAGASGGEGNIGLFRVGALVDGTLLNISIPDNSTLGAFLVQQDLPVFTDGLATVNGITGQVNLSTGFGSDVRFVTTPQVDGNNSDNNTIPILANTPLELVDDGGARVTLQVLGSTRVGPLGFVRVVPVNNSLGVAIAQVVIDLSGGERLDIIGTGPASDTVSIGEIIVTGSSAGSAIRIDGTAEVDVWRVSQTNTDEFQQIEQFSPNGDIVAIDMAQLQVYRATTGDLGRTETTEWGPRLLGPFLGVNGTAVDTAVGGALGYNVVVNNSNFNGGTFRPVADAPDGADGNFLSDQGALFDGWLNGLVVRTGSVDNVTVGGAIGDVILQGDGTGIIDVIANADGITPIGEFDGLIGTIYADIINNVDIGDGLVGFGNGPFAEAGIFAADDLVQVVGGRIPGADIRGVIGAFNRTIGFVTLSTSPDAINTRITPINEPVGIGTILLVGGGDFVNAQILASTLTFFYDAVFGGNGGVNSATVNSIQGTDASFIGSQIDAFNIVSVDLTNGIWDGSEARAGGNVDLVRAAEFRNSSLTGLPSEITTNSITAGENIGTIETALQAGDISDLTVDTNASLTGRLAARNITRLSFDADNVANNVNTTGEIRGSQFTTGRLVDFFSAGDVRTTTVSIAGTADRIRSNGSFLNTTVNITGPDSRLVELSAAGSFTGSVKSAGAINTIRTETGDIVASIETTRGSATVGTIEAARDLHIDAIFLASVNRLAAGRHIGSQGTTDVIVVRGSLGTVAVPDGQLYSDIRANRSIGSVTVGRGTSAPGRFDLGAGSIVSFSRINNVTINGDFDADIISYAGGIGTVRINNGSLLPGNMITAFDGSISEVIIDSGHLLGNIHADQSIFSVRVIASADGVFGDIGINPALSAGVAADTFRNQLPSTALVSTDINGPRITANVNIGTIETTSGGMFEAFIYAGRALSNVNIAGSVGTDPATTTRANVIAAGSRITSLNVTGNLNDAFVLAGVVDFGENQRPGGVGPNIDTNQPGTIESVTVGGATRNVLAGAGVTPGTDGVYATLDDRITVGVSSIQTFTVAGAVASTVLIADSLGAQPGGDARFVRLGENTPLTDDRIFNGVGIPGAVVPAGAVGLAFTHQGTSGRIIFNGPGDAFWDAAGGRVVLVNTTLASTLRITTDTNVLTDFDVVTNDDASVGTLDIEANLRGTSSIVIDAFADSITLGNFAGTGNIRLGSNVRVLNMSSFRGGTFDAAFVQTLNINGDYGAANPDVFGEVSIDLSAGGTININGTARGKISVDRDLDTLNIDAVETSLIRVGGNLGNLLTGPMSETRVSVENTLSRTVIAGNMFDSAIMLGADLGRDADFGGTGVNADTVSAGFATSIDVQGDFERSDITAGFLRGPDGFFGTADDSASPGRSLINSVTIAGSLVGSNANSEAYRIASTGFLGNVTIAGVQGTDQRNFAIVSTDAVPVPVQVEDITVTNEGGVAVARIQFNQAVNSSTLISALSIAEVRNGGLTQILLSAGTDYTLSADSTTSVATITFAREITQRDLLDAFLGQPGPGVYRFSLDADLLRGAVSTQLLDGDGDGFAEPSDDFSQDAIVGDPGDRISPQIISVSEFAGLVTRQVDLFGPIDLDVVLDSNTTPDGLPDTNQSFTVTGAIVDNPHHGVNTFRAPGDNDVYSLTLQAGQILRFSELAGSATAANINLYDEFGNVFGFDDLFFRDQGAFLASSVRLDDQGQLVEDGQPNTTFNLLIRETGRFFLVVGNAPADAFTLGVVSEVDAALGNTGPYSFNLEIFDDGNTGFAGDTDSGDGAPVVEAPVSQAFAGLDGSLNTADDLEQVVIGAFRFTLNAGTDGMKGTADDIVTGNNNAGIVSTRANGRVTTSVSGASGPGGASGVPAAVFPDADVFHLNNGQEIEPGTRYRITVKLNELGSDLGSGLNAAGSTGDVQFAIFDTTSATAIDDALLLLSPSDFSPNGGTPGVIADNGVNSYGYDANGDFFIDIRLPGRVDAGTTAAGTYAVYIQGVFNANYRLEIVNLGAADRATRQAQNVLIETSGGTVEWLRAFGLDQDLLEFTADTIGISGTASNGQNIDDFLVDYIVSSLNTLFDTSDLAITVSSNPNDFEFQDFSTEFLTASAAPAAVFSDAGFAFASIFNPFTFGDDFTQTFGVSQRSDPLNTDRTDEAVVYMPAFSGLGFTVNNADITSLGDALTAAVGRRIGELVGLRITANHLVFEEFDSFDFLAADSVTRRPASSTYEISDSRRFLSDRSDSIADTNFYLGQTIDLALLYRYIGRA